VRTFFQGKVGIYGWIGFCGCGLLHCGYCGMERGKDEGKSIG